MGSKEELAEIDKRLRLVELGVKRLDKSIKEMTAELVKTNKNIRIVLAKLDGDECDSKE